jgi:hypothetical protein
MARPGSPLPSPENRGLTLGWRLGLFTAGAVTLVVGVVTVLQQRAEISRQRYDMVALLDESLGPLVVEMEQAGDIEDVQASIDRFLHTRLLRRAAGIRLDLRDGSGLVVASSEPEDSWAAPPAEGALYAQLPVITPVLGPGAALAVWRSDESFQTDIALHWRSWIVGMLAMVLSVLASVLAGIYLQVTRPLHRLQEGVRQMSGGYMGVLRDLRGAREFRWLAQSLWELGMDLEVRVRSLVDAERRALGVPVDEAGKAPEPPGPKPPAPVVDSQRVPGAELARRYLLDKCHLLETQDPADPIVQGHAREAWNQDVLLAERIGDIPLRSRLDDDALRVLDPDAFGVVEGYLASIAASPPAWLRDRETEMRAALEAVGVSVTHIQRRTKHLAGIWRKMQALGLEVDQIQDVFAFRIIVHDIPDCYRALEALHRRFEPLLLSFKDYIAQPKPNGYRSLHTHLRAGEGPIFEVQIRTAEMHQDAEHGEGDAVHWRYKAGGRGNGGRSRARHWPFRR